MAKILEFGPSARQRVFAGVEKLYNAVSATMGPEGKNVILGKFVGAPTVTKDGVSVARELVLRDPVENLGCLLVKEAAGRTADLAGDGTTTSTVLTHAIIKEGTKVLDAGMSVYKFRQGINLAHKLILEELNKMTKSIDDEQSLRDIAIISANNDVTLGTAIADAFNHVGKTGLVTARASAVAKADYVEVIDGFQLDSGVASIAFLNGGSKVTFDNARILVSSGDILHLQDSLTLFNTAHESNTPIVIFAKSVDKEALHILVENNKLGRLKVCAVNLGARSDDYFDDIALMSGTHLVNDSNGVPMKSLSFNDLGFAESVTVERRTATVISPRKNSLGIEKKIEYYTEELKNIGSELELKNVRDRVAFLSDKAAVIVVSYSTEAELREKGDRVDDAISAVKSAIEEGFVPGAGVALFRASEIVGERADTTSDTYEAVAALLSACNYPMRKIIENAGLDPDYIQSNISCSTSEPDFGYNIVTRTFGPLIEMGVIDPKKVTRVALENAISIAMLLLTTDVVMAEEPENESGWQPPAGWRPPSDTNLNHSY